MPKFSSDFILSVTKSAGGSSEKLEGNTVVEGRGALGGKTGTTAVLPGFCNIEQNGGSGSAPPCNRDLSGLGACAVPVVPLEGLSREKVLLLFLPNIAPPAPPVLPIALPKHGS